MDTRLIVADILRKFFIEFSANPYNFLYEADIQGNLFSRLYHAFKDADEKVKVKRFFFGPDKFSGKDEICINPVKTEYPSGIRFDIAKISKSTMQKDDFEPESEFRNEVFWIQPLEFAVEIKFCQLGDRLSDKFMMFKTDIEKIKSYRNSHRMPDNFFGVSLLFVQPYNTELNNDELGEINIEKLELVNEIQGFVIYPGKDYVHQIENI